MTRGILTTIKLACILLCVAGRPDAQNAPAAGIVTREIEPSIGHNHCTTRQFQHRAFCRAGIWYVFYSDGECLWYQTSGDGGNTWQRARAPVDKAPNGSSSSGVIVVGDLVYVSHTYIRMSAWGCL